MCDTKETPFAKWWREQGNVEAFDNVGPPEAAFRGMAEDGWNEGCKQLAAGIVHNLMLIVDGFEDVADIAEMMVLINKLREIK